MNISLSVRWFETAHRDKEFYWALSARTDIPLAPFGYAQMRPHKGEFHQRTDIPLTPFGYAQMRPHKGELHQRTDIPLAPFGYTQVLPHKGELLSKGHHELKCGV